LFYEVHGPVSRDPGSGSPENLKTVTSGSLAVARLEVAPDHKAVPGAPPASEMRIRFLGAL